MSEHTHEFIHNFNILPWNKNKHKKKLEAQRKQEEYLQIIQHHQTQIRELEKKIESLEPNPDKCRNCYNTGYELGKKMILIQEEGLLEELNILKGITFILKDNSKKCQ